MTHILRTGMSMFCDQNRVAEVPTGAGLRLAGAWACLAVVFLAACSQAQIRQPVDDVATGARGRSGGSAPPVVQPRSGPGGTNSAAVPVRERVSRAPVQSSGVEVAAAPVNSTRPSADLGKRASEPGATSARSVESPAVPIPASTCVAPAVQQQALDTLAADLKPQVLLALSDGQSLAQQRTSWRGAVQQIKTESMRLKLPPPGFGCDNPGMGSATRMPGRATPGTLWADSDCMPDTSKVGIPLGVNTPPALQRERAAASDRVIQLKSEDTALTKKERAQAALLARLLDEAITDWQQVPQGAWTLQKLAGMDQFRVGLVMACASQQGRVDADFIALIDSRATPIARIFDAAFLARVGDAMPPLRDARTALELREALGRLFPTPMLLARAQAQPAMAGLIADEQARVEGLDRQARAERDARDAKAQAYWRENSPAALQRKQNLQNAATNAAPTKQQVLELLLDQLADVRGQAGGKKLNFQHTGEGAVAIIWNMGVFGPVVKYRGLFEVTELNCAPQSRVQRCSLTYTETSSTTREIPMPPAGINRQHTADFDWTEVGLQSANLKLSLAKSHEGWLAQERAASKRIGDRQVRWFECAERVRGGSRRISDKALERECGFKPY